MKLTPRGNNPLFVPQFFYNSNFFTANRGKRRGQSSDPRAVIVEVTRGVLAIVAIAATYSMYSMYSITTAAQGPKFVPRGDLQLITLA
jgi:hypothetical protein